MWCNVLFGVVLTTFSQLSGLLGVLDETGWWCTAGVGFLGTAFDDEGLGVGEFDLDVFLFDAGELAVEFIGVCDFLDVEFGGEGAEGSSGVVVVTLRGVAGLVLLKIVEEAEERREGGGGGGWVG